MPTNPESRGDGPISRTWSRGKNRQSEGTPEPDALADERRCFEEVRAIVRGTVFSDILTQHFEDFVQDIFVELLKAEIKTPTDIVIKKWLRTAATRLAQKYRLRGQRRATDELDDAVDGSTPVAEGEVDFVSRDFEAEFRGLIQDSNLKSGDRALFALRVLGFEFVSLADDLDCPVGTLRARQSRTKARLCEKLTPELGAWIYCADPIVLSGILLGVEADTAGAQISVERRLSHQAKTMLNESLRHEPSATTASDHFLWRETPA